MGFSFETSTQEEIAKRGGSWLKDEGTFHFLITGVECPPKKEDGTLISGGVVSLSMSILEGTTRDENGAFTNEGKSFDLTFFEPDLSSKEGGDMDRRKITAMLIAVGEITEMETGKEVNVDEQSWVGRQGFVELKNWTNKEKKTYLQLNYDNIYHIDHPDVANVPRDKAVIGSIPETGRRLKYAEELKAFKAANGKSGTTAKPGDNGGGGNGGKSSPPASPADDGGDLFA